MSERPPCDLCGGPIEAGESWMAEQRDGGAQDGGWRVAHAGCIYRGERDPETGARWQPQERAAS